mmetsp:Transcript_8281/g.29316  ORF Transcript_8281/g.29316 Transcript_8281/m.29316 type:complete len:266 (+) Transcript_8281:368-1165(+)
MPSAVFGKPVKTPLNKTDRVRRRGGDHRVPRRGERPRQGGDIVDKVQNRIAPFDHDPRPVRPRVAQHAGGADADDGVAELRRQRGDGGVVPDDGRFGSERDAADGRPLCVLLGDAERGHGGETEVLALLQLDERDAALAGAGRVKRVGEIDGADVRVAADQVARRDDERRLPLLDRPRRGARVEGDVQGERGGAPSAVGIAVAVSVEAEAALDISVAGHGACDVVPEPRRARPVTVLDGEHAKAVRDDLVLEHRGVLLEGDDVDG